MKYLTALQKKDGATIRKMAEVPAGTSDADLTGQMEMMSAMTPTDQKIVSGTMNKDTAVLKVTDKLEGKNSMERSGCRGRAAFGKSRKRTGASQRNRLGLRISPSGNILFE